MFTLLKVVGERARSPTTFVMITNQKCQLYRHIDVASMMIYCMTFCFKVGEIDLKALELEN